MKYCIGIDLGGTKINAALIDENYNIVKKVVEKTSKEKEKVLETIKSEIEILKDGVKIEGIGIGSPGTIDVNSGKVTAIGGNVSNWSGTDIFGFLNKSFPNVRIKVENDANCAGLCEYLKGSAKGYESAVILTIGTGMGGCFVFQNEIYHGNNFRATELGHGILYPGGRLCTCGQRGCNERYASGTGIENNFREYSVMDLSAEEVFEIAETNQNAKKAIQKFTYDLSNVLINVKNFFDPAIIVIGGGVINSSEIWWEDMLKFYKKNINAIDDMPIKKAKYKNDAGLIGAAGLILREI